MINIQVWNGNRKVLCTNSQKNIKIKLKNNIQIKNKYCKKFLHLYLNFNYDFIMLILEEKIYIIIS